MQLQEYFEPVSLGHFDEFFAGNPQSIGSLAEVYTETFPAWEAADVVLFGVPEDRGAIARPGSAEAPDNIRNYFYQLAAPLSTIKVADLGNLVAAEDIAEVYNNIAEVCEVLIKQGKVAVLLGGTQDLTFGQYLGFEGLEQDVEYVTVDSSPDILNPENGLNNHSFNNAILTHSPNFLFNFTNLASQSYFITEGERKALKSLNFENVRIGELNANIQVAEPYLRTAHLVSFDLAAVRFADCPGTNHPSPAGLSVEQAATLARYAGMGYNCQAINFCEVNPSVDIRHMTAHLTGILLWYFVEGYYNRQNDQPKADRSNLTKYIARLQGPVPQIVFYKSERTNRWWMEVPAYEGSKQEPPRVALIPCSYADYQDALHNEIPERWWVTHYRYQ